MFHGHVPIQVTLDSGATGNLISSHAAKHIGAHIQPTSQGAHQADGNSPLEVVGETHLTLTMDHKVFHFEGLVVNNLDGDTLGGVPFMAHNDISVRPARREVVFGDGSAVTYPSDNTTGTPTIRRAIVLGAPSHSSTIWPGEYISIDIPSNQCTDRDQSYILEPRYDSKSSHDWLEPQVITSVGHRLRLPNLTGSPVVIKKHDHFCQVRQIFPSSPNEDSPHSDIPLQPTPSHNNSNSDHLLVSIDPDAQLSSEERQLFEHINHKYHEAFNAQGKAYNGRSGPIQVILNMGPYNHFSGKAKYPSMVATVSSSCRSASMNWRETGYLPSQRTLALM